MIDFPRSNLVINLEMYLSTSLLEYVFTKCISVGFSN